MKKGAQRTKNGFTIIETSLVLAIAGLIFLMVFIALPALQRSQRDTQRREDVDKLMTAIKKYTTNNRGALPAGVNNNTWRTALNNYLGNDFTDPSGGDYVLTVAACGQQADQICGGYGVNDMGAFPNNYRMYIVTQAKCSGSETTGVVGSSNPRKYAVLYKLEGGGVYCLD